jgi:hypothetical protein
MSIYEQTLNLIGEKPKFILREYNYRAYKEGECKVFQKESEALQYSKLVEKFCINEQQVIDFKKSINEYNKKFTETFENILSRHYPKVPYFSVIYNYALEISDSNYSYLEDKFEEVFSMVNDCVKMLDN